VITAVDIPGDINSESVVRGGLMLELGGLLEVPESRDRVILSPALREGEKSPFQSGVEAAVKGILDNPRLSLMEKLRYVNTLVVGLDGLIQGNSHNAQVIGTARSAVRQAVSPLVHHLQEENIVVLPHDQAYQQLAVPAGKKVLFLHEQLFDWQGWVSLKAVGAHIVPHFPLGQSREKVLVVAPFKGGSVAHVKAFDPLWHTRSDNERFPIIKTDTFVVIPQELGNRLLTLARRRSEAPLSQEDEDEFVSLSQLMNIYTAEEVVTSYELAPKKNVDIFQPIGFEISRGEIDSDAINAFLTDPPAFQEEDSSTIPQDARQRVALLRNGDVVAIGTGRVIENNVESIEPFGNGYYGVTKATLVIEPVLKINHWAKTKILVHFNGTDFETVFEKTSVYGNLKFIGIFSVLCGSKLTLLPL
jgi:hypothetical protein